MEDDDTVVVSCDVWCGVMWDVGVGVARGGSWFVTQRTQQSTMHKTSNKLHNTKHETKKEDSEIDRRKSSRDIGKQHNNIFPMINCPDILTARSAVRYLSNDLINGNKTKNLSPQRLLVNEVY